MDAVRRRDSELVEQCLNGDPEAWEELVNRYQRLVYSVARALCRDSEDVSDVFQQVWLELYQHLGSLRQAQALPAWLITVTRRQAYALLRSRRGSESLDEEVPDVAERIREIEEKHMLERALGQLPDRCRKLLHLLYFDSTEPSYSQISAAMDIPEPSIGPTRARCLDKLRKAIS